MLGYACQFCLCKQNRQARPSFIGHTHVTTYLHKLSVSIMAPVAVVDIDAIALIGLLIVILKKKRDKQRSRTEWCKKWLLKRRKYSHVNFLKELTYYISERLP